MEVVEYEYRDIGAAKKAAQEIADASGQSVFIDDCPEGHLHLRIGGEENPWRTFWYVDPA